MKTTMFDLAEAREAGYADGYADGRVTGKWDFRESLLENLAGYFPLDQATQRTIRRFIDKYGSAE